ncbi:carbohydrate ABC transporter permease [Actinocrispum wychmicini]|uniref:Multiple sugar transport system permease protein n=1 Tax=Actinocrispum wychmicini TaxID=1213861 RepID=A0A4R2J6I1_9PSEU|nr:carbohydrate ABC transporter permease [Actinocrispum wychmicini]TCO54054.1 multiple sugar transport system permease protein [Actinocrispum wychmicini]
MTTDVQAPPWVGPLLRNARIGGRVLAWIVLTVAAVATIVPFLWMLGVAFRSPADLYADPARLWPDHWTGAGVEAVLTQLPFARLAVNSIVFAGGTTVLLLIIDSLCAYALARLRFRGRNLVFWTILATLMVPFQVMLIPLFLTVFDLDWLNTFQGLIVPRAVSALGIFMLRQFFVKIPPELDEAARVDGAGPLRIYWQIILPLARPALASLFVLQFMALWNDFLWPLVISSTTEMRTLPAALTLFSSQSGVDHAAMMAGAAISLSPLAIAFLVAQRFFTEGIATTGIK